MQRDIQIDKIRDEEGIIEPDTKEIQRTLMENVKCLKSIKVRNLHLQEIDNWLDMCYL